MTIRVDRKTKTRLEKLAKAMDRTNSYVAAEAIRAFVELNEWQIAEIKVALKEADAGDFATEKKSPGGGEGLSARLKISTMKPSTSHATTRKRRRELWNESRPASTDWPPIQPRAVPAASPALANW